MTRKPARAPNRMPLIVGLVALVVGVLAVAAFVAGDDDGNANDAARNGSSTSPTAIPEEIAVNVTVTGEPLDPVPGSGDDPAVGQPFPTLAGTGIDGRPLTIEPGTSPMVIIYLAHWCPHCQREVPLLVGHLADGGIPGGIEVVGVSTALEPNAPNYPPSAWLEEEGWQPPTLIDPDRSASAAAGLTGFPLFVFLDGDGTVVARQEGELPIDTFDDFVSQLVP
ncbi:MAG: TlpA family protein disulfide reductase [Acidimicrobiales bacterium]